uniref:PhoX family protein n=1 Tax=Nocardioides pelophilus TaxID=2172019 RepID=UPI0016028E69
MTVTRPEHRPLLSLTPVTREGVRHGSRSFMTCRFKCGNACDHPVPNTSENGHIQDEIAKAVGRRSVLRGAAVGAGVLVATTGAGTLAAAAVEPAAKRSAVAPAGGPLAQARFRPVAPNRRDAIVVADGFTHNVVIKWGDPVVAGAPRFDVRNQTVAAAEQQFGYNADYVAVLPLSDDKAVMVVNHEYTDEQLMFPAGVYTDDEIKAVAMTNHGLSVVQIKRGVVPGSWFRQKNLSKARLNRRIHIRTEFRFTGPAAGDPLLQTKAQTGGRTCLGTLNNCGGAITPWGTVLTGEENFNQYFDRSGALDSRFAAQYARYGLTGSGSRGWSSVDERFDMTAHPKEPHRFGWVAEIDPMDPASTPRKHTMLGRFKHEAAEIGIAEDGRVCVYMGDDERGDYLYKFVSDGKLDPRRTKAAKRHNMQLLTTGTLYVAKFTGDGEADGEHDGTGRWIPLCSDTESFIPDMSVAEVLVFTRLAADQVGATKMDRPEDVEVNPVNQKIYAALTNNSGRGSTFPADEANPITSSMTRTSPGSPLETKSGNRNGYILEITPGNGDHARKTFTWDLMMICGDPEAPESYFAGYDKAKVSPISCPDNVAFDTAGNLWISTDGTQLGGNDGIFRVPVAGPERGHVKQFLTVPKGAEACGPLLYDEDRS